ncbi:SIS domain-containing protein [Bacillus sp. MRMR6]|uniref:SIS domain-containing protein n=1 Tax=Bacillus sp. MRMR6 TaxID=1928617 RepID=UPI000950F164|nr:SIS domain-containing protein [Bacillus sp. MRMR6]OLS35424.1 phosphosugar isomerase [Bacillus sp. MRMR6]
MNMKPIISEIKQKIESAGGLKAVYFVACGGSQAAIYPANYLIQSEAKNIATAIYNSNEFVHATPASLNEQTICIICSLNATPETVEAVKVANAKGAITIAMTGSPDTLMAQNGQYKVVYSNGDNQVYSQANQALALKLGFEILHQFENYEKYDAAMSAYDKIDAIVEHGKVNLLPQAQQFAKKFKKDEVFYVLGSGPLFGTAYTMACCHFMEMQWKHAITLNSGEYFHGPFETTDKEVALVLLKSVGRTRPMDDRVETFLKEYAERYIIIDAEEIGLNQIDSSVAEFFNSVVMIPIERFFVYQMSLANNHPMEDRRYMWKVAY